MNRAHAQNRSLFLSLPLLVGTGLLACASDPDAPSQTVVDDEGTGEATTSATGGGDGTGASAASPSSSSSVGGGTAGEGGGMSAGGMGPGAAGPGGGGDGGEGGGVVTPPGPTCQGPLTGADQCGGDAVVLSAGTTITLCGDISASENDYQDPFCGPSSNSGDNVYNVETLDAGTLTVRLKADGPGLNPTMFLRFPESVFPGACSDGSEFGSGGCWNFFDTHEEFAFDWDPVFFFPGFHLFVDGDRDAAGNPTSGAYELELSLQPAQCGDGVVNFGEVCDDGNAVDGDGCSSACEPEPGQAHDTCPGEHVFFVDPNNPTPLSASTQGHTDDFTPRVQGSCDTPAPGGQDRVFRYTAMTSGLVRARIGVGPDCETDVCDAEGATSQGCWDAVLWVTENECGDNSRQVACSDNSVFSQEQVVFWGEESNVYYIIVDGFSQFDVGEFNLCVDAF
ncbi:MAG: myxococcus cysteine-rich repeat containing protein [Myxococcota bacterium]